MVEYMVGCYGSLNKSLHHSEHQSSQLQSEGNATYVIVLNKCVKFLAYSRCSDKAPCKYYYPGCLGLEFHRKCSGWLCIPMASVYRVVFEMMGKVRGFRHAQC